MIELAILGLLKERSMHGYQLRKRLSETLGPFWQVSYGSLYPALKRLQGDGAVEVVFPKQEVGRRKNVYRVTDTGEELFSSLAETPKDESEDGTGFMVRLAFFRYLKPETRLHLLERRRAFLSTRADDIKQKLNSYRERVDGYTLSLMRHGMDATEHDIRWLDDMIEQERGAVGTPRKSRRRALAGEGAET